MLMHSKVITLLCYTLPTLGQSTECYCRMIALLPTLDLFEAP